MVEARSGDEWMRQPAETGDVDEATADVPRDARPRDLAAEVGPVERAREQSAAEPDARDASDIGREVAAVLEAAEASAQRIRAKAQRDADAIRADAEAAAERLLADAQREGRALRAELQELRKEIDAYGKKVRGDAEAYAADARKSADEEGSQKLREAEDTLRSSRREAAKIVRDATADGQRRKAALEVEAAWFEERFANILTVFHGISSQLEGVLRDGGGAPDAASGGESPPEKESLADDLKEAAGAKSEGDSQGSSSDAARGETKEEAKSKPNRSSRR